MGDVFDEEYFTVDSQDPYTFDPGEHTIEEVGWFLRENPTHRSRIITLEAVGKKRKGIIGVNPTLAIKLAVAGESPTGRRDCPEVHPIYATACERQHGHSGPCTHIIYWNED